MFSEEKFRDLISVVYGADITEALEITIPNAETGEGSVDGDMTMITIKLNAEKTPLFIGRGGRNIKSLREMFFLYNKLHGTSYGLQLLD